MTARPAHGGDSAPRLMRPAPDRPPAGTMLAGYVEWLEQRGHRFEDYAALHRWSVEDLPGFWASAWEYLGVRDHGDPGPVLSGTMPHCTWFPAARVNYAENALLGVERTRPGDGGGTAPGDRAAIVSLSESRERQEWDYARLRAEVAGVQRLFRQLGVGPGDRVVGMMPNVPEAAVAFLAAASLGAVWAGCSPELGPTAVLDRFGQLEPTVLVAVSGYRYGGRDIDRSSVLDAVVAGLPGLRAVVHVPYGSFGGLPAPWGHFTVADVTAEADGTPAKAPLRLSWRDAPRVTAEDVEFTTVPFDHPLCVLFSSGTTGAPKALVHTHGGFLAEHAKNGALSWDLQDTSVMYWATTTSWMVWNSLVSALLFQGTIVMADGNLMYPDISWQWRTAAREGVTLMGVSPAYLMTCRAEGLRPARDHDLSALRQVGASGSPLPDAGYEWVAECLPPGIVFNIGSGGTDVCTGFVQSGPWCSEWVGEMSAAALGVDVVAYDDAGTPVLDRPGELVVRQPMPSMPRGLWGDDAVTRYRQAYFDRFPGVWTHGDLIQFRSDTGSCAISGRSDATLNRGGIRAGTAEYYNVVEAMPEVEEALVVHVDPERDGTGQLVLFVVPAGADGQSGLEARVGVAVREGLSPRHVPDVVRIVPAVPRNRTGKKLEIPVKRVLEGVPPEEATSMDNVADPESMRVIARIGRDLRPA
ncbi:MAG: acetoacetate--CoA ligase [Micrococcus sp.]|nr:acetoacetate--CoA ligase [Micrococcus sp.]